MSTRLTKSDRCDISTILRRRANNVASYLQDDLKKEYVPGDVQMALDREVVRLRDLAAKVCPDCQGCRL